MKNIYVFILYTILAMTTIPHSAWAKDSVPPSPGVSSSISACVQKCLAPRTRWWCADEGSECTREVIEACKAFCSGDRIRFNTLTRWKRLEADPTWWKKLRIPPPPELFQSAKEGSSSHMYWVGMAYWHGLKGFEVNHASARQWLEEAEKNGNKAAGLALTKHFPKNDPGGIGSIPWCSKPSTNRNKISGYFSQPLAASCSAEIVTANKVPFDFGPLKGGSLSYVVPFAGFENNHDGELHPKFPYTFLIKGRASLDSQEHAVKFLSFMRTSYGPQDSTVKEDNKSVYKWTLGKTLVKVKKNSNSGTVSFSYMPLSIIMDKELEIHQKSKKNKCLRLEKLAEEYARACRGKSNESATYGYRKDSESGRRSVPPRPPLPEE